jgi:hypothetical protein
MDPAVSRCHAARGRALPSRRPHSQGALRLHPGDDYKLADYNEIISYFQKLTRASDRILLAEFGKTRDGQAHVHRLHLVAGELKKLDLYRGISRRLALGEPTKPKRANSPSR